MANYKLFCLEKVTSTQDVAREMVANGNAGNNCVVIANAQSAGRGRYNRKWVSHHGNLYASFIYGCDEPDARIAYSVAVAVAETLMSFGISPQIKWPNDVLVDGKKISGILIEYYNDYVIVGVGINIESKPTVPEYKTIKMSEFVEVSVDAVFSKLLYNMKKWRFEKFPLVREHWLKLAIGLNKLVKYRGVQHELVGINDNGALILRRDSKYYLVYGDEISM